MLFGLWEGNTFYDFLMDNSHCNKKKSQSTQCTDTNTHTHIHSKMFNYLDQKNFELKKLIIRFNLFFSVLFSKSDK